MPNGKTQEGMGRAITLKSFKDEIGVYKMTSASTPWKWRRNYIVIFFLLMNFYNLHITCLLMCTNTYLLLLILINYNHVTLLSILILYLVSFLVCVNIKFIIQVYWLCKDNILHPLNCYSIISLDWIWAKMISLLRVLSSVEMISNRCYFQS